MRSVEMRLLDEEKNVKMSYNFDISTIDEVANEIYFFLLACGYHHETVNEVIDCEANGFAISNGENNNI